MFAIDLMKTVDNMEKTVVDPFIDNNMVEMSVNNHIVATAIIFFSVVNVCKEIVQLYQQRIKYLTDLINLLEWILYLTSMAMVMPRFTGYVSDYNLTSAATAIFIAWLNFLLYLQRFDRVGIYVVMFLEILQTLVKALLIFSILFIAFGLSFFVLMSRGHHLGFSNVPMSLIRVFNMMLGEFDVMGTFIQPYFNASITATTLPYPNFTMGFLIIFMVFMPILLVNLLIGLAVGDIESVRRNAYLKRLAMQVDLHTELEKKIPKVILNRIDKEEITEYPNSVIHYQCQWFWKISRRLFGSVYTNDEDMKKVEANALLHDDITQKEFDKQKARIKEMSTSIQQMHHMVRLIVQKMEIRTEANDIDEGDVINDRKYSKWTSPTLAIKLRSVSALNKARRKAAEVPMTA
ncbi:hypothetical protein CHUAL_006422 [Chamberlinius hualienensis]